MDILRLPKPNPSARMLLDVLVPGKFRVEDIF
jgi:hypothetical protein